MNKDKKKYFSDEIVFVAEVCCNCSDHGWNTLHDEKLYEEFFKRIAGAIVDRIPQAKVMKNSIPKSYAKFDLYNNLIPNVTDPYYEQVPTMGAFEVSYKGMLLFSKLKGGYWPNVELIG